MGNENTGRRISRTVGHRKKLSDISNTPILLKSRIQDENAELMQKEALTEVQEELGSLKKMLAEKEEVLAESKRCMEKLWGNYCRKSKQNDEIILHNSQLYRDLTEARDQLKILQHENIQMSAVYKACKLELQEKLNEALEQIERLKELLDASSLKQAFDKQCPLSTGPDRSFCEITTGNLGGIHGQSVSRRRERKSYKELSLKVKLRQPNGGSVHGKESIQFDNNLQIPELVEAKGTEKASIVAASESFRSEATSMVQNESQLNSSYQCTEKGQNTPKAKITSMSTHDSCDRPRRRAASSMGSYKEPPLNTKMRRAD